jgi:hypothetical protein
VLAAAKGSENAKLLAASLIAKHSKYFPALADAAINAQFDLCEDLDKKVCQTFKIISTQGNI